MSFIIFFKTILISVFVFVKLFIVLKFSKIYMFFVLIIKFVKTCLNGSCVNIVKPVLNRTSLGQAFLAHLAFRPCELLSSLFVRRLSSVVRRPSVNISHFNLLLRNHWTNCNQTLVEWSLDGPLSKLCPVIPYSNQDGRQAQNRKGGMKF